MIHIVVVAHGKLADELVRSLQMIIGKANGLYSVGLAPSESLDEYEKRLLDVIDETDRDKSKDGVLILADMFGGSCANLGAKIAADIDPENIAVITGVNLPVLLDAVINRDSLDFNQLREKVISAGKRSLVDMSDLIRKRVGS